MDRAIVITGAGGGLGGASAALFADRGWQVFGADLVAPVAGTPVHLDVTDAASCGAAAKFVGEAAPGGVAAVVNFAGVLELGALVEISEERMRRIVDINVLGTYRVNKAMYPLVRRGGGRIVNISSEVARRPALPLNGPYAMTKSAVEAYSDALRRELMFVGIPVVVVQPGPFRTSMTGGIPDRFADAAGEASEFARLVARIGRAARHEGARAHDPAELAETIWTAVTARVPRHRYCVRPDRRRDLLGRLPTGLADRVLKRTLR
jgi:NAD(P)-dependent dehydrogenase (short-subunit alcohol dehydrogenase family)